MASQPQKAVPAPDDEPFASTLVKPHGAGSAKVPSQGLRPAIPTRLGFDEETRLLLRRRLLLCHGACAVSCLGLLLSAAAGADGATYGASMALGVVFNVLLFVHSAVGALWLWRRPGMGITALRAEELALFGNAILLLGILKVDAFVSFPADSPDPRLAQLAVERAGTLSNLPFYFIILYYGVLIPNTRRRSLLVISAGAAVALLATALSAALHPAFREFAPSIFVMTVLGLLLSGTAAVFSSARINTLQRQAYEARREAQHVGPYLLKRMLGKGGMGAVYLAEHKLLKRPCAVKLIHPEMSADPESVARFIREVQAVTALTHLHTVRVYDYGRAEDGTFYYVMEYLDGQTLDALVRRDGPLAPGRAVHLLRQVCGALGEAHTAGLVHRDLKPGNIFVATLGGQPDVAKLLDFGLVRDLGTITGDGRLTRTGTVLGTPTYMSPEQAGGEPMVDGRLDIYSLGATAFFAVTGRPPFEAPSAGKLLAAHLTQTPPRADQVCSAVPPDLANVVARCLAKEPADRFQTAAELDAALAGCACAAQY